MAVFRLRPGAPSLPRRHHSRPELVALEGRLLLAADLTSTTLTPSSALVAPGDPVILTATVRDLTTATTPTGGTVTFYADGNSLGTATLVKGTATLEEETLTTGTHNLSAFYSGSSDFATSRYGSPTAAGIIATIAGQVGETGSTGDNGPATAALIGRPYDLALDAAGDLFIAAADEDVVRKVTPDGTISTVAGTVGGTGSTGDGGPATAAQIGQPQALAFDAAGDLFLADPGNHVVRKVTPDGTIKTVAGTVGGTGSTGDGGLATSAQIGDPKGLAVDAAGDLFIADASNYVIREVTPDGTISTVAGVVDQDTSAGDGGPATSAAVGSLTGLAFDAAGDLFLVNPETDVVRKVTPDGIIHPVAGEEGLIFSTGDGGPATSAAIGVSSGLAFDAAGDLFIADPYNGVVRKVTPDGIIHTVAGVVGGTGVTGDGGPATAAQVTGAYALAVDAAGDLYITELFNDVVREVGSGLSLVVGSPALIITGTTTPLAAGQSETLTLTANSPDGTVDTANNDLLTVSSTDPTVAAGTTVQLVNGVGTLTVALNTVGSQTITFTEKSADAAINPTFTTPSITVVAPTSTSPPTTTSKTLTGLVFQDLAGTGTPTAYDPALAQRTVYLDLNGDGTLDNNEPTTTTDTSGRYSFTGVTATNPTVRLDPAEDASDRDVVTQSTTAADGSVNLGDIVLAPVAPLAITPGLASAAPTTDPTTAYVEALYRSVLGRNGSGQEVTNWLAVIDQQSLSRAQIATGFVDSPEHRQAEVASFYERFLQRAPDPTSSFWVAALEEGATESEVARSILNSPEYNADKPSNSGLVESLYNDVLARQADDGLTFDFSSTGVPTAATIAAETATFVDSGEAHDQAVASFYEVFLHRQREGGTTAAYWTNLLDSGTGSVSDVEAGILSSDEYVQEAMSAAG